MGPDTKDDRGFEELRREVIESRNLVIKTDNLLKNLHAELKMVSKRQEDFQRRQWLSSAAAYGLFVGLCAAFAVTYAGAKASASGAVRERLEQQLRTSSAELEQLKRAQGIAAGAQRAAEQVYTLMTTLEGEERLKGVDELAKLELQRLSTLERQLLSETADRLRREVGQTLLERGKAAYRRSDFPGAVEALTRFLALKPSSGDALDASFFLGVSLYHVRRYEESISALERFIGEDKRAKTRDYAMLMLAQAYQQVGTHQKAIDLTREALATYPDTEFSAQLKGRLSASKRALAPTETAAVQPGAVEAAAVPPTTPEPP